MSHDLVTYAFSAGEVSETLFGRSDLEKYDLGLSLARNWFIDYRGGMSTRPGLQFRDYVQHDQHPTKFFKFSFAPNANNTYVVLFGLNYIRFLQSGGYILEDNVNISGITQADPGVITANSHGYSDGDWVKVFNVVGMTEVNGRLFEVVNSTTNTFELRHPLGGSVDTSGYGAYVSDGTVRRVYTLTSPYDTADFQTLRVHQSRNLLRITHPDYAPRSLIRTSDTDWTLSEVDFGNSATRPTGVTITPSTSGSAGFAVAVTAVMTDGQESQPSDYKFETASVDFTTTAGSAKYSWTPVSGALYYNVYRSNVLPDGGEVSRAMEVGFIGKAYGAQFTDNNIVPDFTSTPPDYYNPFADGTVQYIEVTAGGSSYTNSSTVSISTSTGSGFIGYPVVNDSGVIIAVVVVNGGSGYDDADTVSFSGGGSGATATATFGPTSGNNPAVSTIFQQRQIYAATDNNPISVWGSKPAQLENFDVSRIVADNDSYEFELDSQEVAPIRHLIPTRSGMVIMSQAGIWQLTGGQGTAVTPTNALADPQTYTGCSLVTPLLIDTDLLYIEDKGNSVRLLEYNDYSKVYAGRDMSILANHLITSTKPITRWAYAADPYKLVYAVRSDGALLTMTLVKEHNVFAWAQQWTKGLFLDVMAIQEGQKDSVYVMTQRYINGRWTKFIETFAQRTFDNAEVYWGVDAGLETDMTYPNATLQVNAATGDGVTATTSATVFTAGDVGSVIRAGGGRMTVATYVSGTEVTVDITRPITDLIPEDPADTPLPQDGGSWTMDATFNAITNLEHLEGETVAVLADGNALTPITVVNGTINLGHDFSHAIVGLPYTCVARTLPAISNQLQIDGKRKRIIGTSVRINDTRGLKQGASLSKLYEMKERTTELFSEPPNLQEGQRKVLIETSFDENGQTYFVQDGPLPATVLGYVLDVEIGDDSN